MKKYRFKWWYLVVGIVLVLVVDGQYHFLGSIVPGQGKDFVFSHFGYAQDEEDHVMFTSSTFDFGNAKMSTSKVGYDGCADLTIDGEVLHMCEGNSFLYNKYTKITFNPILKTSFGGYKGG